METGRQASSQALGSLTTEPQIDIRVSEKRATCQEESQILTSPYLDYDLDSSLSPSLYIDASYLADRYARYRDWLNKQPYSPHTIRAYEARVSQFLSFLKERIADYEEPLSNTNTRDYVTRDFKQYLKLNLKSPPWTVNSYLTAIDSFYSYLGLGKARAKREELPKLAPRALEPKEQKDFLRAVERRKSAKDRALAITLFYTGMRISECAALNLDDVRVTERKGYAIIRDGKGGKYREVPLNSDCRQAIRNWLSERQASFPETADEAFFLSQKGRRLSVDGIDHIIRTIAADAKLEGLSADILRHTLATNMLRDGADVVMVSQILGHKKLETTMGYSLATLADQADAVERIRIEY